MHLPDVINFKQSFRMASARPDNASHGALKVWHGIILTGRVRQVGFTAAGGASTGRCNGQASVMLNLMAFERFGDYAAAREYIDGFLTRYTDFSLPPSSGASGGLLECLEGGQRLSRFGFLQATTEDYWYISRRVCC